MSDLSQVLAEVAQKIGRYRSRRIGEQNTKATLIQPVLRALGWNVEDLEDVQLEYKRKRQDKPVDYALLLMREPCLFVEAKPLGENLDDRKWANQIIGYASMAGVEWVALTNGDEYRIFAAHAAVPIEDKLFRSISITGNAEEAAETLILLSKERLKEKEISYLWRKQSVDRKVRTAIEHLFGGDPDASLVRLLAKRIENLSPGDIKASLRRASLKFEFPPADPAPATGHVDSPAPRSAARRKVQTGAPKKKDKKLYVGVSLAEVIEAGLFKVPLKLYKKYRGHHLEAELQQDGSVIYDGVSYTSCSTAADEARRSIVGGEPHTNGWTFWQYRDSGGQFVLLDAARQAFIQQRRS